MSGGRTELHRPIVALFMMAGFASRVFAQNMKITGSTEFRPATYAAIVNALTNPQIACIGGNADGADMSSATEAVVTGTYNGQLLVIHVNWSSSYTGLQAITAGTWSMKWLSTANISS